MHVGKILGAIVLMGLLEADYQYYDYKGSAPVSLTGINRALPEFTQSVLRNAGTLWGKVTGRYPAVTLLPDHVMLCVPRQLVGEWELPADGSPMARYKADAENSIKRVAARVAKSGIVYDESPDHFKLTVPVNGPWIAYVEDRYLRIYEQGEQNPMPVDLRQYNASGRNLVCGNTYGHEHGR